MFDTETVEVVWSKTFHDYAEPLLGRKWDLHAGEDFPSQNTFVKFTVPDLDIVEDEEYDGSDFQRWLDGGEYSEEYSMEPGCGRIAQYLHEKGHIPAGTYGVDIWW